MGTMSGQMMKKAVFSAIFVLAVCTKAAAFSPEVELKLDEGTVVYVQQRPEVPCAGGTAAGCTDSAIYMDPLIPELTADGKLKKLKLSFGFERLIVEISSKYPQGTCNYDVVMRHEMRHVAYARGVLKAYAPKLAEALKTKAASLPVPLTQEAYNSLTALADRYFSGDDAQKDAVGRQTGRGGKQCLRMGRMHRGGLSRRLGQSRNQNLPQGAALVFLQQSIAFRSVLCIIRPKLM